jgi:hypothetical protein
MMCYDATGLRHLALFQYHRLAAELREAFQARPSDESRRLYEQLRRPDLQPAGSGGLLAAV